MKKIVLIMFMFMCLFMGSNVYAGGHNCRTGDCNNLNVVNQQEQTQIQGQNAFGGAGVGIGGSGGSGGSVSIGEKGLSPSAAIDLSGSFNSEMSRDFPIPGQVIFPGTPSYFGPATVGHNFIPLSKLTMYNIVWDKEWVDNMISDKSGWTKNSGLDVQVRHIMKVNNENSDNQENEEENSKIITSITKPKNATSVQQLAFATVAITDDHKISPDAFSRLLKECYESGGNVVQFLAEGIDRKMRATGGGIGLNNSVAVMSSGQGLGNMAVGGMGYTSGTSGYVDRPWLQATFLKVLTKNGEPLEFNPPPINNPKKADNTKISELEKRLDKLVSEKNTKSYVEETTK